jgi:1-deoxy-D-xylulose-5-phosphate synthase
MFSDLGLKYVGPIDGHDITAVETALRQAKQFGGPVLVHCLTRKGNGFSAAEAHEEDRFHAVGKINAETGESLAGPSAVKWTDVFSEELLRLGSVDDRVVAITAAMVYPTGLHRFARAFPDRVFDVGIAEQHAVTSAAGLAMGGLHPVVAIYSTFLNRGFDQLLMDVALHRCGVTFILDRAGVTGPDGASHHGMWDMSILQLVPGLHLTAPPISKSRTTFLHWTQSRESMWFCTPMIRRCWSSDTARWSRPRSVWGNGLPTRASG